MVCGRARRACGMAMEAMLRCCSAMQLWPGSSSSRSAHGSHTTAARMRPHTGGRCPRLMSRRKWKWSGDYRRPLGARSHMYIVTEESTMTRAKPTRLATADTEARAIMSSPPR